MFGGGAWLWMESIVPYVLTNSGDIYTNLEILELQVSGCKSLLWYAEQESLGFQVPQFPRHPKLYSATNEAAS